MKRKYIDDKHAVCPFYKTECATEIKCQGLCSDTVVQEFRNEKQKQEQKYSYCCGLWQNCEHSRALNDKFEYENGYKKSAK